MQKVKDLDEYLALQTPEMVEVLLKVRNAIMKGAPKAEEVISYGMPAFRQNGILVYYAAFKKHYSLFPGASGVAAFKKQIKEYPSSKGGIQFDPAKPVPVKLIIDIVKFKVKENTLKAELKKKKAKKK